MYIIDNNNFNSNSAIYPIHLINIIKKINKLIKEVNNYIKTVYSNK